MTFTVTPSHQDLIDLLNAALETSKGTIITCATPGHAVVLRQRLHKVRSTNQKENREIYPLDHPLHGRSVWDRLVLRIEKGSADIRLELPNMASFKVKAIE